MKRRIPWQRVSENIIHRNPAEWVEIVEQRGTGPRKKRTLDYKFIPGGPCTGRVSTRLPFQKGDRFYWIFGLAQVRG